MAELVLSPTHLWHLPATESVVPPWIETGDMTFFYSAFIGWLIFNALYVLAMSWRSNPRRASD
jgi:hypothetical protein